MALDRRGFVRGCAALLASAVLPRRAAGASGPAEAARFGGFQPGIQSFSLRAMELPEALDTVVALGLGQVELIPRLGVAFVELWSHFPVTDDAGEIARLRGLLDARGLRLGAHGVNDVDGPESAERLAVFAEAVGIPVLTVSPDRDVLAELDPVLAAHPTVRFAIHNHGPGTSYATIADVESALAGRHPGLGACVDTGHFIRAGEDPVEALRRVGPRVYGVHLKDFEGPGFFASGTILGAGSLDVAGTFAALREIGFPPDGPLMIEYEQNPDDVVPDLRACLAAASAAANADPRAGEPGRVRPGG